MAIFYCLLCDYALESNTYDVLDDCCPVCGKATVRILEDELYDLMDSVKGIYMDYYNRQWNLNVVLKEGTQYPPLDEILYRIKTTNCSTYGIGVNDAFVHFFALDSNGREASESWTITTVDGQRLTIREYAWSSNASAMIKLFDIHSIDAAICVYDSRSHYIDRFSVHLTVDFVRQLLIKFAPGWSVKRKQNYYEVVPLGIVNEPAVKEIAHYVVGSYSRVAFGQDCSSVPLKTVHRHIDGTWWFKHERNVLAEYGPFWNEELAKNRMREVEGGEGDDLS